MFRNFIALLKLIVVAFYSQETKCLNDRTNKVKTTFLFFKTYFFDFLSFVKSPRKKQAAHGVSPRKNRTCF